MRALAQRPWAIGLASIGLFALLVLPLAGSHGFDSSVFILAGDAFVRPASDAPRIFILPHSLGYDGQFYYRFALNPFLAQDNAYGVRLDYPPKRMLRLVYPILAWMLSLGQVSRVPLTLVLVNLAELGGIAACAAWLARRHGLAWWLPVALVFWPGFLVALTHDTAEVTSAFLLLLAIACFLSGRLAAYAGLAALAALARETSIPILAGIFAVELWRAAWSAPAKRRWRRVGGTFLPMLPCLVWSAVTALIWHQPPQPVHGNLDIGWPLVGLLTLWRDNLAASWVWLTHPAGHASTPIFVLVVTIALAGFCGLVLRHLPRVIGQPGYMGLAMGWLLILALMSLLTQFGPYVEPLSTFRAYTECWVVGCLLLAKAPGPVGGRALGWVAILLAIELNLGVWKWSYWLLNH